MEECQEAKKAAQEAPKAYEEAEQKAGGAARRAAAEALRVGVYGLATLAAQIPVLQTVIMPALVALFFTKDLIGLVR